MLCKLRARPGDKNANEQLRVSMPLAGVRERLALCERQLVLKDNVMARKDLGSLEQLQHTDDELKHKELAQKDAEIVRLRHQLLQ